MDIGLLVADARARAGLTQQELARRAGTSQSAVARLERGQGSPSVDTVRRLVAAAGFELRFELATLAPKSDAVVERYKRDVDRSLLRENLRKSVGQRLEDLESFRKSAARLRRAVRRGGRS